MCLAYFAALIAFAAGVVAIVWHKVYREDIAAESEEGAVRRYLESISHVHNAPDADVRREEPDGSYEQMPWLAGILLPHTTNGRVRGARVERKGDK